ncbi:MAG: hypothetical protein ACK5PG_06170 [Lysobacterales bacterium]|jgi:hypothetical protein
MSVTTYRSTDAGAPVLRGTTGNGLVNLLTICLTGTGTAYGSLPKKGWTLLFTGTNKAVFCTVDGVGFLRVVNDGTGTGGFREAIVRAAEGATGVDTLVDPFPTVAEMADSVCVWRCSDTLDTTARAWQLTANENWFILSVRFGTTSADTYLFGKFSPIRSANSWPYVVNTRASSNAASESLAAQMFFSSYAGVGSPRLFAMRTVDGVSKSPRAAFVTEGTSGTTASGFAGSVGPKAPNDDGEFFISPPQLWVNGASGASLSNQQPAGFFPNLWVPLHNVNAGGTTIAYADTFNAAGYDPSANFSILGAGANSAGKLVVETTDTWQDPLA